MTAFENGDIPPKGFLLVNELPTVVRCRWSADKSNNWSIVNESGCHILATRIWKEIKKGHGCIPTFPAFDLQGDLSQGWRKYVSRFENLLLAMNITNAIRKKGMLLGEEVNKIFDTLDVPEATEEEDIFRKAEKALREYFTPQKNLEFEVYKFRQAKQLPGNNSLSCLWEAMSNMPEI